MQNMDGLLNLANEIHSFVCVFRLTINSKAEMSMPRSGPKEIVIIENIRLVRLLDLTADFGSQNKRNVDADFHAARGEQNWYSKLSVHSNNLDFNFCVNFLTYIL